MAIKYLKNVPQQGICSNCQKKVKSTFEHAKKILHCVNCQYKIFIFDDRKMGWYLFIFDNNLIFDIDLSSTEQNFFHLMIRPLIDNNPNIIDSSAKTISVNTFDIDLANLFALKNKLSLYKSFI